MKLDQCIEIYVANRRRAGYRFFTPEKRLKRLARFVGNVPIKKVTAQQAQAFLDHSPLSNGAWRSYHGTLRNFFMYWCSRGQMAALPLPPLKADIRSAFYPYIYSRKEVRALLDATDECQRSSNCAIDPETVRVLLLFLYGTGIMVGDALALLGTDVDLDQRIVGIQRTQWVARKFPISRDLQMLLSAYLKGPVRGRFGPQHSLFVRETGEPVAFSTLRTTFHRLRKLAKISREPGAAYQPRLHEFRHTFAVHSITSWTRRGLKVDRMLPLLAAYLGEVGLTAVDRCLKLTPVRFQRTLRKLEVC